MDQKKKTPLCHKDLEGEATRQDARLKTQG